MAERKREYTWYIRPSDSRTNKAIAEEILTEDFISCKIKCSDGGKYDLWECPSHFIQKFMDSKEDLGLKFKIYGKQGCYGKIREKTFLFTSKWRRRKRAKAKTAK